MKQGDWSHKIIRSWSQGMGLYVTGPGDGWITTQVLVSALGSPAAQLPGSKGGQPGGPMQSSTSIDGKECRYS